ncbi:glycoside hydrolase family 95 protein [Penicillium daleae]|uniref:Glycoside hydrolase family 95 protein n=1 Tax=Penicillium daleae TaxID=63821 RepID=A0AAD6CB53_9EURO|nr:glycoside hydrolase family 95 protein [Penicillium daleae]KAJ5459959.1 glycoside hydrolase family 95 protein [Penicillium daleae]
MASDRGLYYKTPSTNFSTSLPLGNGRLAASVMSSPDRESLLLNEVTFWSGAPHTAGSGLISRPADPKAELRTTQRCLLDGNFNQAKARVQKYLESKKRNFGTNLGVGRLDIVVHGREDVSEFERELNLNEALTETRYKKGGHDFRRRCFVSHPHQVLVVNFVTSDPDGLELAVCMQGEGDAFTSWVQDGRLHFVTQALENVHSDGTCGVKGHGIIAAVVEDGKIEERDGKLIISGQGGITILLAFNTNYHESESEWKNKTSIHIDHASKLSMSNLLAAHLADYQLLYQKASLTLGSGSEETASLPTDERRRNLQASKYTGDPGMFALYFHFARYLTIAGTRADSPLPLHLQGLWNDGEACRMGWSCDYHLDINTQMNYFHVLPMGITEAMQPMVAYLTSSPRRAKVLHVHVTDPGWEMTYGLNVTGGLWMASHLIEIYEYTLDDQFLRDTAYPLLKGAAEFFLDYMIEDLTTGWLLTAPSISPENSFLVDIPGKHREEHCIHLSPTLDIVLLRDLFNFCLYASKVLETDTTFAEKIKATTVKLPTFQVGKHGQLQEWLQDFDEAQPYHRHLSHTMALCRSAQVSVRHTPDLAQAIKVSLERRQDCSDLEDIEFTAALFGLNYARLDDGEKALSEIGHLVSDLSFDNLLSYSKPGVAGAEENIFVVDGNFGGAAAIMEMLVRSSMPILEGPVEVDLLPALPKTWTQGRARGFRLRGGLEIDLEWSQGVLTKASFRAMSSGTIAVYYGGHCFKSGYQVSDIIELGSELVVCR